MANRIAHQSTVKSLTAAKNGFRNLDELTTRYAFGVSKGTLSRALTGGSVSARAEDNIRETLGLAPHKTVVVEACPDCGSAHTGRCHNRTVAQVVVLAPGERVVKQTSARRKRAPRKSIDLPPDLHATLNAERCAAGESWSAYLERLAIAARTLRALEAQP